MIDRRIFFRQFLYHFSRNHYPRRGLAVVRATARPGVDSGLAVAVTSASRGVAPPRLQLLQGHRFFPTGVTGVATPWVPAPLPYPCLPVFHYPNDPAPLLPLLVRYCWMYIIQLCFEQFSRRLHCIEYPGLKVLCFSFALLVSDRYDFV